MGINKVQYGNTTLIDLTNDTVTADKLMQGYTAHDRSGALIIGTATQGGSVTQDQDGFIVLPPDGGGGGGDNTALKGLIEKTITEIDLPNDLTKIGQYAFYKCTGLESITLPNTVTAIDYGAFMSCTSLQSVVFSSGLLTIGSRAFSDCPNLNITTLPSSVQTIGNYAFMNCSGIIDIYCDGNITNLAISSFLSDSTATPMNIVEAKFPNLSQTSIGTVFGSTTANYACKKLQVADIGEVASISANAFANCYKLQTLVLRRTGAVCSLANVSAFLSTPMRGYNSLAGTVYVPSALISTYQTATNWSTLYNNGTVTFVAIEGSEYEL